MVIRHHLHVAIILVNNLLSTTHPHAFLRCTIRKSFNYTFYSNLLFYHRPLVLSHLKILL